MLIRNIFYQIMICYFSLVSVLTAGTFSIQPLAQEITLAPGEEKVMIVQLYNSTRYTQIITLQMEERRLPDIITNFSWQTWCTPDKIEYQLVPGSVSDVFFHIRIPEQAVPFRNKKLGVFCFFSGKKNKAAERNNSFTLKPRIGAVLYVRIQ